MLRRLSGLTALAFLLAATVPGTSHADPSAVDAIFNTRHLDLLEKGGTVNYKFERKVSDEKLLGQPFTDDIKIDVGNAGEEGRRDMKITVFTGDRQRPIQDYESLTINPVFIWFLDRAVDNYRLMAGGSQPYLKGRFREAFVDKAKIEAVKINYAGKSVDGFKIAMKPYEGDPNASKMQGYEGSEFTITVSKDVPGYFYELDSTYSSTKNTFGKLIDRVVLVDSGARP
ncbi:MAG: hypothetical protein NW216_13480 [Hyphomicrobium sp.]|nr:hypothetical protein [Hyphomicrobium sp.]